MDAVSTAAQEARNPQRDMPIGILASLAVCTVLYILMALVMTGLAHYTELNVPHPVYVAIEKAGPSLAWLGSIINIGATAGLASVVLGHDAPDRPDRLRNPECPQGRGG